MAQMVKSLPAMQETWVRSLGQEDSFIWKRKVELLLTFAPEQQTTNITRRSRWMDGIFESFGSAYVWT